LTVRARQLLTAVNLHFAGVAALIVLDLFLLAHLLLAWQAVNASDAGAIAQQRTMLTAARIASRPLEGIDTKIAASTEQADSFYQQRLPYAFSQVLTELGALTARENVRLSRVQYAYQPVLSGPYALTEVRMDASIAGEYRGVIGAINALERDRLFFTISSITLTGQQTGQVNLRLRVTTWLRSPGPSEVAGQAPANITVEPAPDGATPTPAPGGAR
jgi:type IV pilus assembly protein PilO